MCLSISSREWHPFTISSAPEVGSHFTLHIRGVGHWTNQLHQLFEDQYRNPSGQSTKRKTGEESGVKNLKQRIVSRYQSKLEIEQQEQGGHMNRFLDMHMYVTSALQSNDMKAVALQMALSILYKKEERDLITGALSNNLSNDIESVDC